MLVYVRYNKDKFQYDVTKEYFRAAVTPGRTKTPRFAQIQAAFRVVSLLRGL